MLIKAGYLSDGSPLVQELRAKLQAYLDVSGSAPEPPAEQLPHLTLRLQNKPATDLERVIVGAIQAGLEANWNAQAVFARFSKGAVTVLRGFLKRSLLFTGLLTPCFFSISAPQSRQAQMVDQSPVPYLNPDHSIPADQRGHRVFLDPATGDAFVLFHPGDHDLIPVELNTHTLTNRIVSTFNSCHRATTSYAG
jgi:hypothetical protein